ncbi:MAG: hypothetical protein B6241_07640 [Spirochaetaceae bacterium 4572_59]|nr:MAG: hypothetical protein B6241_07640 [Spirochaetaceae bacterium 4572_59]
MLIVRKTELSSRKGKAFLYPLLFCILITLQAPLFSLTQGKELETVIVQFEITQDMIRSKEAYTAAIRDAATLAMKDGQADLLIFPEYLGVFASLIPWNEYLKTERPFELVWREIALNHPELTCLSDLFISGSAETEEYLNRLWGELAKENEVYILSGTRFNYDPDRKGLMNQAVVFNPNGQIEYRQNKHFLTEFEEDILGLTAGDLRDTGGFTVKDHLIRLTICRDTFLKKWETLYREGDLWIDIKANGVAYTPDQADLFTKALPARLAGTPIPYGITACLTGSFLNLLWEGESSIIKNNPGSRVSYLDTSTNTAQLEILRKTFP